MKKNLSDPAVKFFISFIGLLAVFYVLKELQHIFIPFTLAYFLYFVFEPFNSALEKRRIPHSLSTVIDLLMIMLIVWVLSRFIIDSFVQFGEQIPVYEDKLNKLISTTAVSLGLTDALFTNFDIRRLMMGFDYTNIAGQFFSSTLSIFSGLVFILFFFIFISSGHAKFVEAIKKRYLEKNMEEALKKEKKKLKITDGETPTTSRDEEDERIKSESGEKLQKTFKDITQQIQKYLITKFLISLTTGVIVGFVLWLFNVDFYVVWAVITLLLNFIPNIGSAIAVILPTLMALVQHESFGYAMLVAAVITVIQNLIGNIIEPKLFGDRLGLNPLVIILSLLIWGYVWGIVGMILSVPLTAVLKIVISNSPSRNMRFITNLMSS